MTAGRGGLLEGPGARCGATALIYTVLKVAGIRRPIETSIFLVWGDV
jgi:hypothetical protein